MVTQWIAAACSTQWLTQRTLRHSSRRAARPRLEDLEHRLAMSSYSGAGVVDLNLIVVKPDGRQMVVSPYNRHAEAAKKLQPNWIQVRPAKTSFGSARTALEPKTQEDCTRSERDLCHPRHVPRIAVD